MRKFTAVIAATVIITTVYASGASAATSTPSATLTYTAIDLGPGGADDINDLGQVAGESAAGYATVWSNGVAHDLGTLPAPYNTSSTALSINDLGEVAGISGAHGFIWRDGHMTDLGTLGGPDTTPTAISNTGVVVGYSATKKTYTFRGKVYYVVDAFEWVKGHMTNLGTLGGEGSYADDINTFGTVAGQVNSHSGDTKAATWANGQWTPLAGGLDAYAINDRGQVLGDDGTNYPYLWTAGTATSVYSICPALSSYNEDFIGVDLNDLGWITGTALTSIGPVYNYPVVCQPDGTVTPLPALPGSLGDEAAAINNLGEVVGSAGPVSTTGQGQAVLWRPSLG